MPTLARTLVPLTVAVVTAFGPSGLGAQSVPNHLYDRYQLSVSATGLFFGTKIRVDPTDGGEGTEITFEDELGVDKASLQPRAALRWRFGRRHELEGGYVRAMRSQERVLTDTIVFRDTSFAAGLRIALDRTSQAFVAYRYTFNAKDHSQVGVGLGLGVIFLRAKLDALAGATSGGQDTAITQYSSAAEMNGPTASLGVFGRFLLSDRWYVESEARTIYIKVDNFSAGVIELDLAGRYFLSRSVGLELGYSFNSYGVKIDRKASGEGALGIDLTGKVSYTVQGLRGGVIFAF